MSRRKPLILMVIAVFLGLVATTAAGRYMEHQAATRSGPTVLAAKEELKAGTCITEEHLQEIGWPGETVPDSLVTTLEEAKDKYTKEAIVAGEPLLKSKLSEFSLTGRIAEYVPEGYRAMAIKVDNAVQTGGLLEGGSLVDVLTVVTERGRRPMSKIILQNIKVLSVGKRKVDDEEETSCGPGTGSRREVVVTLLLKPEEAEKLAMAMTRGTIQVMARGTTDTAAIETDGFSADGFLAREKPKPDPKPKPVVTPVAPEQPLELLRGPDELFNTAETLRAKGELREAQKIYDELAEEFSDHRLATDAVKHSRQITIELQKEQALKRAEQLLRAAHEKLDKGLFADCRTITSKLAEEFGSLECRGEKVSDIVTRIRVKTNSSEKRARVNYQLFRNWLQAGDIEKAEEYLRKLRTEFPES
jgi:pilus assembly protein CpaB